MFDVGLGEMFLIALIGLVVFGPDRLPTVITQASSWLRQLRETAAATRQELSDSLGSSVDDSALTDAMRDLRELHPRNLVSGLLDDPGADSHGSSPKRSSNGDSMSKPTGAAPSYDPDAT